MWVWTHAFDYSIHKHAILLSVPNARAVHVSLALHIDSTFHTDRPPLLATLLWLTLHCSSCLRRTCPSQWQHHSRRRPPWRRRWVLVHQLDQASMKTCRCVACDVAEQPAAHECLDAFANILMSMLCVCRHDWTTCGKREAWCLRRTETLVKSLGCNIRLVQQHRMRRANPLIRVSKTP